MKPTRQSCIMYAVAAFFVITAYIIRFFYHPQLSFYRPTVYVGLVIVWELSIHHRLIHVQVRRFYMVIGGLIFFWIVLRTLKFNLDSLPVFVYRYLWYMFYIPMLFLPVFALYVAISLGRPETQKLSKGAWSIFAVTACLFIMVLTNDLHQKVFSFPMGLAFFDTYSYRIGYLILCIWCLVLVVGALGMILYKCRIPGMRKMALYPLVPMSVLIVYAACYAMNVGFVRIYFGDITIMFSLLIILMMESFFLTGLIPTNTHYLELFSLSSVKVCITDSEYRKLLSSNAVMPYTRKEMQRTENRFVLFPNGMRLSSATLKVGHVVWEENLSGTFRIMEELSAVNNELQEKNELSKREYKEQKTGHRIREKNRIFNRMQEEMQEKHMELEALLDEYEENAGDDLLFLLRIGLLGVYLKRRNNLLFEAETENILPAKELDTTLADSLDWLSEAGIDCMRRVSLTGDLTLHDIIVLFDTYESIVEAVCDTCRSIAVDIFEERGMYVMEVSAVGPFDGIAVPGVQTNQEDENEWQFSFELPKTEVGLC